MLVLTPNVVFEVHAVEPSAMLLTVSTDRTNSPRSVLAPFQAAGQDG
jgi:hypothetical protein